MPALRAKPGNPGYGFRRAKWRNVSDGAEDQGTMQETLLAIGLPRSRCDYVRMRVDQFRIAWEQARRPSRPAGPGRPRGRARGDRADGQSPEPVETYVEGVARGVSGLGALGSSPVMDTSMLLDGAALQYVKQIEQMAALKAALGRPQQLGSGLLPAGLLSQQHHLSLHPIQRQAVPAAVPAQGGAGAGVGKPLLMGSLGAGSQWLGGGHSQTPTMPGFNLGLAAAAGTGSTMQFPVDALKHLEQLEQQQQQQRLASGGATLPSPAHSAKMESQVFDAAISRGLANMPWAGLSAGLGLAAGAGGSRHGTGCGVSLAACGGLAGLPQTMQASWKACALAAAVQVQPGEVTASKRWRSEEEESGEDGRDVDDDAALEGAAAGGSSKRSKRNLGCSTGSAAREMHVICGQKGRAAAAPSKFARAVCVKDDSSSSSSALPSSASTSLANSPAERALDKIEQEEPLENKASLNNLLTG